MSELKNSWLKGEITGGKNISKHFGLTQNETLFTSLHWEQKESRFLSTEFQCCRRITNFGSRGNPMHFMCLTEVKVPSSLLA